MRFFTKAIFVMVLAIASLLTESNAQSVIDPSDPVITYNAATPPTLPAGGQIGKWVRTKRLGWNTDSWKCYYLNGVPFRVKFPKTYNHTAVDGKKYPAIAFLHGLGEKGPIYDNEFSMANGGVAMNAAVDNGLFDGFIIIMQSEGGWAGNHYAVLAQILEYMATNNKLDIFQTAVNGLSAGGYASWDMMIAYPKIITASLPMSGISVPHKDAAKIAVYKYKPIWYFQGGLDQSPHPSTANEVNAAINAAGANYRYTLYPNLGHGTWNTAWSEPDFYPFVLRSYSSNPWPLFGRTEFCPGDPINVTVGLTPGFDQYEWRKDGQPLAATGNSIQVTSVGIYSARIRKGSVWSEWSRTPVEIKLKAPTVTPPITVAGLMSKVLPALDTTNVTLAVPAGYQSYEWQRVGNPSTIGTAAQLSVSTPGDYIARVTEQFGCSSSFSAAFTVINANGPNKPSPAGNVVASALSKTSVKIDWTDNPTPQYNETNYEVYQATKAGGPYKLVGITAANSSTFTVTGLTPKTKYFYKVRGVNNTGAAAASNEATATTESDTQAPTAPGNLTITGSSRTSIGLSWTPSTDDIGVIRYEVYVNGVKAYPVQGTSITINELTSQQSYNFTVRALDGAGNQSPFSNQVTGQPVLNGLSYKHYTFEGTWNNLQDFSSLTPVATGMMPTVAITPRVQDENFAFLWEGYIVIPISGTYYFRTNSDDGSKLYLGSLNGTASPYSHSATAIVNNDGLHGSQDATSSARSLTAGVYPIAITFYEQGGGEAMTVSWRTPLTFGSYTQIPASAFKETAQNNGSAPAAPSALAVSAMSFKAINLTWTDNSNNENGFEIWRSTSANGTYAIVGRAAANATFFVDSVELQPSTAYFYRMRATGQYGESAFAPQSDAQANWKFDNNYNDASPNGRGLSGNNSPTFNNADKQEGTHSVDLNGSNEDITVSTSSGDYLRGGYTTKSVAFWMRADVTSSIRGVFDFGGTDDGLAMAISSNVLQAGIASNNVRRSITTPYSSTAWNHIALVYSGNTLRLYVNGTQVAQNTSLGFTSVGTTSDGSMIGDDSGGGDNALTSSFGQFDGRFDDFYVFARALTPAEITALMNKTYGLATATTLALPATPAAPTALLAAGTSTSTINVTWTDNAANETGYEIYRSSTDNSNFIKLASLAANSNSFADADLFANAIYYYKVRAIGAGGNSTYSNEDSAKTKNNAPLITAIDDKSIHHQTQGVVNVVASDVDADYVTLTPGVAPAFATFQQNGNGTGVFTFAANSPMGVYPVSIIATDGQGGSTTETFQLTVNDNYNPAVAAIANQSVAETQSIVLNLSATDQNAGDVITWSVNNVPDGYTLTPGANGSATLQIQPGYAGSGVYNVEVKATDNNGGVGTQTFTLTVTDKDPNKKIYARVQYANVAGAPWNNMTGTTTNNLKDESNNTTSVGINFLQPWWLPYNAGPSTGNNSGVYPDAVLNDFWYFGYYGGPETAGLNVTGLDPAKKYNLTFYAGSVFNGFVDNGTTQYTVGAKTVSLYVQNNTQNTVSISNIAPAAAGTITVNMTKAPGSPIGYLNALVITELFDDGTAPAAPKDLVAQTIAGQGIRLNWNDVAYNEVGYEVYRSTTENGSYSLVATADANSNTYLDNTVSGATQYFYKLRGTNSYGNSAYTAVVTATTANRIPQLAPIANIAVKNNQSVQVNVTATDDATDNVTLTASNLPSFATFTDNGNGTGFFSIAPPAGTLGTFAGVTVQAKDNSDSTSTASFTIFVTDAAVTNTYVNITNESNLAPKPWNNFVAPAPFAGLTISNLKDDNDANTGINVTLTDAWQGASNTGLRSGNGRDLYPSSVSRAGIYSTANGTRRITVTGLDNAKRYNFVFFNSHGTSENATTTFAIGATSVSLNAEYNGEKTVQINGVAPVNGTVTINVSKGAGAITSVVSSIVIQSYTPGETPVLSPTDLRMVTANTNSISLTWQDRADNETAYEVWRAADGGSYSLLATLAANVTSYTNSSLPANANYNYIVRAKNGAINSAYSNPVKGYTYNSLVHINFNGSSRTAPSPWNNLNWVYGIGASWDNFKNANGTPTNIGMRQPVKVDGLVDLGVNTGNNSGIFPDNVMIESFGMFPGLPTYVKLVGLSTGKTYDFTFFASVAGYFGDQTTFYTINGKTVLLNAHYNKSGTVTMYDVQADENGELEISFGSYETATFGLLGALIIKAHDASEEETPAAPASARTMMIVSDKKSEATTTEANTVARTASPEAARTAPVAPVATEATADLKSVVAFPNPFDQGITVNVPATANETVQLSIVDMKGTTIYQRQLANLNHGANPVKIDNISHVQPGVYIVRVVYVSTGEMKTVKIVKR